jgi:hypothetical protein
MDARSMLIRGAEEAQRIALESQSASGTNDNP